MSDENKPNLPQVITSTVQSPEGVVEAVRAEIPVGVAGAPIDRLPYQEGLALLAASGTTSKRIASTDRCIRVIEVPLKGGGIAKCHCSRACVSVGDMRLCPDHDKGAFQPSQTPHGTVGRTFNSASVPLTKAEKDDLVKTSKSYAETGESPLPSRHVTAALPNSVTDFMAAQEKMADAKYAEPHHDLKIYLTLDQLESGDIRGAVAGALCDALDSMPAGNMRQMKRIVALQEKLQKLFKAKGGRKNGRRKSTPTETL
jgi:hypothetical protein